MSALGCRKLLFDTNAILDLYGSQEERPRRESVVQLVSKCFEDNVVMVISVGSLKDAYYITRRTGLPHDEALRRTLASMRIFEMVDLCSTHARSALVSDEPDFEDGLIRVQAEELGVDAIVTDDRHAFATCEIPHLSAADCLKAFWPDAA